VSKLGERAVVCGAGIGGVLAARVLADFYQTVTVVEGTRCPMPSTNDGGCRRGGTSTCCGVAARRCWHGYFPA
jgi:2-polyprenyl-6-methoxyphenol hydroxylase-like FAD-dependent oxidoreductase